MVSAETAGGIRHYGPLTRKYREMRTVQMSFCNVRKKIAAALAGLGILGCCWLPAGAQASERGRVPEYRDAQVEVVRSGPTLMFSDSPEMVYETGILYSDVMKGDSRVFFHHVNGMKKKVKLAVLIRPAGNRPVTVTWGTRGIGDPDSDYFVTAKNSQRRYFRDYRKREKEWLSSASEEARKAAEKANDYSFYRDNPHLETTILLPGDYYEVLTRNKNSWNSGITMRPEDLMTGMVDFTVNRPAEVLVVMYPADVSLETFLKTAKQLPMDEHPLRGTYEKADLTYTLKDPLALKQGESVGLAMGRENDPHFIKGPDAVTGQITEDYGNYGVVYHIRYRLAGLLPVTLSVNPWGGDFSGTGLLRHGEEIAVADMPGETLSFGDGEETAEVGRIFPKQSVPDGEFLWSPPGASNLPIRLFWTAESGADYISRRH